MALYAFPHRMSAFLFQLQILILALHLLYSTTTITQKNNIAAYQVRAPHSIVTSPTSRFSYNSIVIVCTGLIKRHILHKKYSSEEMAEL